MEQDKRKNGEVRLRILEIWGSNGMPSCGATDAGRIGQGEDGDTVYIGQSDEHIEPGTPLCNFPFWILHQYTPWRLPKSPRNMERHLAKKAQKKSRNR